MQVPCKTVDHPLTRLCCGDDGDGGLLTLFSSDESIIRKPCRIGFLVISVTNFVTILITSNAL